MRSFLQVSLLALCLALTAAEYSQGLLSRSADLNLMQFMMNTRDISQGNSGRSLDCFTYYVPVLNAIAAEYEASYARCLDTAEAQREGIDGRTQYDRYLIEGAANNSCDLMNSCSQLKDSISYFQCYAGAGSDNSKTMYTISANASTVLAQVVEDYRLIENNQNRCTNQSDRAYVENTASTYDEMQSCIMGLSPVPTTTASPPTDSTYTTTEAPTVTPEPTTEESTTEESTTEESTTEESTTEESTTEESTTEESTTEESTTEESTTEESTTEEPTTEESTESTPEESTTGEPEETTDSSEEADVQRRSRKRLTQLLQDIRNRF